MACSALDTAVEGIARILVKDNGDKKKKHKIKYCTQMIKEIPEIGQLPIEAQVYQFPHNCQPEEKIVPNQYYLIMKEPNGEIKMHSSNGITAGKPLSNNPKPTNPITGAIPRGLKNLKKVLRT